MVLAHGPGGSGSRAGPGSTAYLGTGAQRLPGHRAHRPCRRSACGTCTPRCRSCRPCTSRAGYRGCWRRQGKLREGMRREVRSGLVRSPAHAPPAPVPWRTPGPLAQSTRSCSTYTPTSAQNTLSCRSTHPSLTTLSPLLCSQPSWGLGGPGGRVCSLGTLTSALAAVLTRAAAGLPGGGDTVAVAAPAQALGVTPVAGPGPHTAQGQGVQRRGRPELGEVAPAGLRAALGQEGSGCKPAPVGPCPTPPPSAQPLTCSCEPGGQGGSSPQMLQTFCKERKATRQVEWVDRTVPSGLGIPSASGLWPPSPATAVGSRSGHSGHQGQAAPAAGQCHRPGPPQRAGVAARFGRHPLPP